MPNVRPAGRESTIFNARSGFATSSGYACQALHGAQDWFLDIQQCRSSGHHGQGGGTGGEEVQCGGGGGGVPGSVPGPHTGSGLGGGGEGTLVVTNPRLAHQFPRKTLGITPVGWELGAQCPSTAGNEPSAAATTPMMMLMMISLRFSDNHSKTMTTERWRPFMRKGGG